MSAMQPSAKRASFSGSSARKTPSAIAAGVVFSAILVLAIIFIYQHDYLHHAVTLHGRAMRLEMKESDWQTVWNFAGVSRDRHEFLALLRSEGMTVGGGSEDVDDDDAWEKEERDGAYNDLLKQDAELTNSSSSQEVSNDYEGIARQADNLLDGETLGLLQKRDELDSEDPFVEGGYGEETSSTTPIRGNPPPMSALLARKQSVNETVIVTWANYALWDFVKNWVKHVQELGITNFLVGAMDQQIGEALVAAGIPSFSMYSASSTGNQSGVGTDHLQWGGESFHKMGRQKISLAKMFLDVKIDLLLVDVDVVILKNVLHYFDRFPEADILVSSDKLSSSLQPGDEGLENPALAGEPMNIGIMYFRYNQNTTRFVNEWLDAINAKPDLWDQLAFNDLAHAGWDPYVKVHPTNKRVFIGFNGSIGVGILPSAMFSGGHTFFIQRLHEVQRLQPYAVHCTFQYGGNIGKRNRMREAMIFYDEEEYYTRDNYIMTDVLKTPTMGAAEFNSTFNYTEMKAYNVKGLYSQLESVFPAIGLSFLLNRTLIVPKLACYCDRSWMPLERCRLPGATLERLPFLCPMDYVLDPIFMTDKASSMVVKWREHSFLENPRCPQSVKQSKLTIYTKTQVSAPTEKYNVQDGGTILLLPAKMKSSKLELVMKKYEQYKVWHFKDAATTFSGFEDPQMQEGYMQRINHLHPIVQPEKSADGKPM